MNSDILLLGAFVVVVLFLFALSRQSARSGPRRQTERQHRISVVLTCQGDDFIERERPSAPGCYMIVGLILGIVLALFGSALLSMELFF